MNKHVVQNPWGLTLAEVDVMDALCSPRSGYQTEIAKRFKNSADTIRSHLFRARAKMRTTDHPISTTYAAILWDRWRQGEGKDIPA